ncbi:unnamed protein product [Rotaria sp. Silwood1]|nr:unnamed protein product [Rotaria sp. Silwood1]CAF1644092.1 unnamed protein product [Rotaria sp. Silwood1]CAF3824914.1 unnamed protein product [Rotaria sp. Silwood1]CAF4968931.1 unnamed protein product [Rotaria sp. Silwood1]
MRLLHDQIRIICFDEYKQLFIQIYLCSRIAFTALRSLPSLYGYLLRNYLIANGKFREAVEKFRSILLSVPILIVESCQDTLESQ